MIDIHFEFSLDYCKNWENEWEIYFKTLDDKGKESFGLKDSPPKIETEYLNCRFCGKSYKNFRDATDAEIDKIYGSTVNPILNRNEDLIPENKK